MKLLNLKNILAVADQHKFGVGAFNAIDSNFIDAVFHAAQTNRSPIIINVAEVHLKYIDIFSTSEYIKKKAALSDLPVCLNLDHGLTFPTIEKAIQCGFSSVMFDGSSPRRSHRWGGERSGDRLGVDLPHLAGVVADVVVRSDEI